MSDNVENSRYFYRILTLVVDIGTDVLLQTFYSKIPEDQVKTVFAGKRKDFESLRNRNRPVLTQPQYDLVTSADPKPEEYDISLLSVLLRNVCPNVDEPTSAKGWNVGTPDAHDTTLGAEILKFKAIRNKVTAHTSKAQIDKHSFVVLWREIKDILIRMARMISVECEDSVEKRIADLKDRALDPMGQNRVLDAFIYWQAPQTEKLNEQWQTMQTSLNNLQIQGETNTAKLLETLINNFAEIKEERNRNAQFDNHGDNIHTNTNPHAMSERDLDDIARRIGHDWSQLMTYLEFKHAQKQRLEIAYPEFVHRVSTLLMSWHDVVVQCGENPRELLAAAFLEMSNREMACFIVPSTKKVDEINEAPKNYRAKKETIKKINAIDFKSNNSQPASQSTTVHYAINVNHGAHVGALAVGQATASQIIQEYRKPFNTRGASCVNEEDGAIQLNYGPESQKMIGGKVNATPSFNHELGYTVDEPDGTVCDLNPEDSTCHTKVGEKGEHKKE